MNDEQLEANILERMEQLLEGARLAYDLPWLSEQIHELALRGKQRLLLTPTA